jgi:transcriptional regulator with XRE-family HTH domain
MTSPRDSPLGEYIRQQRELQKLSMRQLADLVGISNPYLSQIERGLREPSEKVVDAIARNLELSAEALHAQGGRRDENDDQADRAPAAGPTRGVWRIHWAKHPAPKSRALRAATQGENVAALALR